MTYTLKDHDAYTFLSVYIVGGESLICLTAGTNIDNEAVIVEIDKKELEEFISTLNYLKDKI